MKKNDKQKRIEKKRIRREIRKRKSKDLNENAKKNTTIRPTKQRSNGLGYGQKAFEDLRQTY